ncbi:MAG: hypothetical protein R3E10_12665 [Gemmatimonadota bacterium]
MSATRTHEPEVDRLRRAIIRSAAQAVNESAPLDVIDPRGMIFDRDPTGRWTLRVRGTDRQMVLGLGKGERPWVQPDALDWRVMPLDEDVDLPGRRVLGEAHDLETLVDMALPLTVTPVTYRRGRRAVLRIASAEHGEVRYLKLLSRKALKKAHRAVKTVRHLGLDCVLLPRHLHEGFAALVFDELSEPSLHDRLWAGDDVDLAPVLEGLAALKSASPSTDLPRRNVASERESAELLLRTSVSFLPGLGPLLDALRHVSLPELDGVGLIHGDLHDKQIFFQQGEMRLIDAESLAVGAIEVDLVNLAEHLRLRGLQGCEGAPACAERLWAEADLDRSDPAIQALSALVRARLAAVYARRPWWWGLSLQLADEAVAMLAELD